MLESPPGESDSFSIKSKALPPPHAGAAATSSGPPPASAASRLRTACWHAALISGDLKVVHKPQWDEDDPGCLRKAGVATRFLLFNLTSDPAEADDLAATSAAWSTVRDELVARLAELAQDEFQSSDVAEPDATSSAQCTMSSHGSPHQIGVAKDSRYP